MDQNAFMASLSADAPPEADSALQALWLDRNGDWEAAHDRVQGNAPADCWVHAYLHRKEGDQSNAGYWYRRADQPAASASLDEEWSAIVAALTA
ncbi:MAG: hypothetical protein CMQ29_01630 [Gammaproteobacteria bacterium]|jgi:hypothetical protein|nr:hypothetical protein [Gammaproteobacteria bacterium]